MEVEGVLDTPVEDPVENEVENEGIPAEGEQQGQEEEPVEEHQEKDSSPVISDANGQLRLSDTAKAKLDEIKAENPRLAREIRASLFDRQTLAQKGLTVKQAIETIEAYEAEGGSEAVKQVKEELGMWKDLDADFQAAKPEFVNDIANGNPEAFTKIVPIAMAKLAETSPEVFSYEVSKVFSQDMMQAEIPFALKLFRREIEDPQNPGKTKAGMEGIAEVYNTIQAYVDRVAGLAKNAPKEKQAQGPQNPSGNSELDQREQNIAIQEFGAERSRVYSSVMEDEFKKNLGNRKITESQKSAIRELFDSRLDKTLRSDKNHTSMVDRFFAARDKAGYARHMAQAYKAKAPAAMAQAFRVIMPGKSGNTSKPAAKSAAPSKSPVNITSGFTRVGQKPDPNQIDWTKTANIPGKKSGDGKFIMRDGSKVLYQR